MFGPAGHAYVYFTMGAHYCLNITTEAEGTAAAVLIRAIEPLEGVDEMKRNRGVDDVHRLTNGPGNLTRALEIDRSLNGEDITVSTKVFVEQMRAFDEVGVSSRVGVSSGRTLRWRFFATNSPFVSKRGPTTSAQNP